MQWVLENTIIELFLVPKLGEFLVRFVLRKILQKFRKYSRLILV